MMYELILIDSSNKWMSIYSSKNLFEIDCFTGEYLNREDFLNKMSEKLNKKITDVMIKSTFQRKERYIKDIMYANNYFPNHEFLILRYAKYLFEDKSRISNSFLVNLPRFKNANYDFINYFDITEALSKNMTTHRKRRDCYFQLVNSGYLKPREIKQDEQDYLKSIIDEIDTDLSDDDDIMIDKIKNGEIEPNYYDIEDYLSMKRHKRR